MVRLFVTMRLFLLTFLAASLLSPLAPPTSAQMIAADGGRMIQIQTPRGRFHVWVKTVGDNPRIKLLLLHGGPAVPHDYLEPFGKYLPQQGYEIIYYDQLGAGNSDKPDSDDLWTVDRYVDEVEQLRKTLKLDAGNFCLYGHSWGGILAMEYALKYQQNLKCLIISNMMASIPAYNIYAHDVLMPQMDPAALAEVQALEKAGKTSDPHYMELLIPLHYEQHILRMPSAQWPDAVNRSFAGMNEHIYTLMQGPSELGASGRLEQWDRFSDLARIRVPTLVIGARYDTMDPLYMAKMAIKLPKGEFLYLPDGSHLSMWDDQQRYFEGVTAFLKRMN